MNILSHRVTLSRDRGLQRAIDIVQREGGTVFLSPMFNCCRPQSVHSLEEVNILRRYGYEVRFESDLFSNRVVDGDLITPCIMQQQVR